MAKRCGGLLVSATVLSALMLAACGGSGGQSERELSGVALGVISKTVQPDRSFVVVDLAKSDNPDTEVDETVVATGVSDALGAFSAKFGLDVSNVFVAFPATDSEPRTSGLFSVLEGDVRGKDLEDFTDIACVAGARIVGEGVVPALQMDGQRIANLEAGAREVLATQSVDFNDPDSFDAAVQRTRALTSDGSTPPAEQ